MEQYNIMLMNNAEFMNINAIELARVVHVAEVRYNEKKSNDLFLYVNTTLTWVIRELCAFSIRHDERRVKLISAWANIKR